MNSRSESRATQSEPCRRSRISLARILVWLLLLSVLSSLFVSVRFPPLAYLSLVALFALLLLWERLRKALGRRFAIMVDATCYSLAAAVTLYLAPRIDLATMVPEPENDLLRFLFGWPEILADAIGYAVSLTLALAACFVVAIVGASWTIGDYAFRKIRAWDRARREAQAAKPQLPFTRLRLSCSCP